MPIVNVYINSTLPPDEPNGISAQSKRLYDLFSSPLFQTTILKLDQIPNNIKSAFPNFSQEALSELYRFMLSLKDGSKTKDPILYITDTSITDADASTIEAIVTSLLTNDWDVCYLSKWLDSCDLYGEKKQINKNGTVLVNSVNPHGIQAIMIRPDRFTVDISSGLVSLKDGTKVSFENSLTQTMQKLITGKKILATTVSPNLFNVDPSTIQKKEDWIKLNECRQGQINNQGNNATPSVSPSDNQATLELNQNNLWLWILLIVLIVIILFLFLKR
jgi:hypothetical protein